MDVDALNKGLSLFTEALTLIRGVAVHLTEQHQKG